MSSSSAQLATMNIFEPFHQVGSWSDAFRGETSINVFSSAIPQVDDEFNSKVLMHDVSNELIEPSRSDQESNKPSDKVMRRLAQNREAARKSRLRKKAYVQQLESSRLKLSQLEQELQRAKQQGLFIANASQFSHLVVLPGPVNSGITAFEMEYGNWIEEQHRQISELRNALQANVPVLELEKIVESSLNHYNNFFRMKANAAKSDVFYMMSGKYRTSVERFFLWIGGFRPSDLIIVLTSELDPLTAEQFILVGNLRQSSQQAEDALTRGIEKLQQILSQSIATDLTSGGSFRVQMADAIEKLEALEGFVNQADHLRQQTLYHMSKILTTHQAARGLLALGEYLHRLRALSSLWAARPREPVRKNMILSSASHAIRSSFS